MKRAILRLVSATLILALAAALPGIRAAQAASLPLIRDAEIEGLMRLYSNRIFKVAGLNPGSVHVYLVNVDNINAFVAGGQRVFIHVGLLVQAKTPNEVIGVLAHETAHIAGGHLARLGIQVDKLSTAAIIGTLVGAAAAVGSAVAGQGQGAAAGQGMIAGSQELARRSLLSYARAQESAADQAAVRYLNRTHQSAKGMLTLFEHLASSSIGSIAQTDPYLLSHPMPFERIRNLERLAKASKYYNTPDPPALVLRHKLMQAKLIGYLKSPQMVYRRYPVRDNSIESRYARAIVAFKSGDIRNALPLIKSLIRDIPQNPYFWELQGEALLKNGQAKASLPSLLKTAKLLPNNGLVRMTLAQALLAAGGTKNLQLALTTLKKAKRTEDHTPHLHTLLARVYGQLGQTGRADLETAEAALLRGDKKTAQTIAKRAKQRLANDRPALQRANDILNYAGQR